MWAWDYICAGFKAAKNVAAQVRYHQSRAERSQSSKADETASKVALALETGLRPNQRSASRFVASPKLRRLTLANYQQRVEALRMYGISACGLWLTTFQASVSTTWLPRLALCCCMRVRSLKACKPA